MGNDRKIDKIHITYSHGEAFGFYISDMSTFWETVKVTRVISNLCF